MRSGVVIMHLKAYEWNTYSALLCVQIKIYQ